MKRTFSAEAGELLREIARLRQVPDQEIVDRMIPTSTALHYFVWKKRTGFRDFIPFIKGD